MGSQRDSQCAQAPKQTRTSCFRRTLHRDWPRQCHIGAGTGRPAATAAPGRCFEWPSSHLSARLRTRVPYLSTSCKPSVAINTTGTDASRPSFTPTSAYIAAITAPPPSSMSTLTGVPTVLIELPSKCSECSIVVACYNSPPMCVRPWDDLTNGTPAANTLRILLSVSPIQHLSLLPRPDSCRVISSAVGKQSTPRAAPDNSASDTEGAEEETDGAARLDAFAEASLADELAADGSDIAVES